MKNFSLCRLSNHDLTSGLAAAAARERVSTAELVAYIAEFDARGLYRPAGYPSMHQYCETALGLSQDSAYKRIQVARAAREFPRILEAMTEGRLHLSGANVLVPYLTAENAGDLIAASAGKTKWEIQQLLADRFPSSESLQLIESISSPPSEPPVATSRASRPVTESSCQLAPAQVGPPASECNPLPLSPQRFSIHLSFGQEMLEDLRQAQGLLGHSSSDVAAVLHRGLKALIRELEKRKIATTDRPRECSRTNPDSRAVPAQVRREVWLRDGGRCTFIGDGGNRCSARARLEFDHIQPVALGGQSIASNVRLLCREHNQYAAELVFGSEHMSRKREEAAQKKEAADQVMRCMRRLGFTADESRRAAAHACTVDASSLEARVRAALGYLVPPRNRQFEPAATSSPPA